MPKEMLNITPNNDEPGLRVMGGNSGYAHLMRKRRKAFQSAPVFETQPAVSGGDNVGETASVGDSTATSRSPATYTYQWQLNGVNIPGQTARTILLLVGMIGGALRCVITASNRFGVTVQASLAITVLA